MAVTTRVKTTITAEQTSAGDLYAATAPHAFIITQFLQSGTGADQADLVWSDSRTVAASATDSLDLAGALTSAFGASLTFAKVKLIAVKAAAGNTNSVVVTRPASNGVPLFTAAGDSMPLLPGASVVWCSPNAAGVAVTAGTGDLLDIVNSAAGTSVSYDILIVGTSA